MPTPTVAVNGAATASARATCATIHASTRLTSPSREIAWELIASRQQTIIEAVSFPVVSSQARSWRSAADGATAELHTVQVQFTVTLDHEADVERAVNELVGADADVSHVSWELGDDAERTRQVRHAAVADARTKARDYADAVGMTLGDLLTIGDPGSAGYGTGAPGWGSAAPRGGAPQLELAPPELTVSASVELRYALLVNGG